MPDQPTNYEPVTEVSTEPWVPLPSHKWTEPERWVWEQVRTGQIADFNERYSKVLDPKKEEVWNEEEKKHRGLRSDFLRTIILCEPWRGLITHMGVRIGGAFFKEEIDLGRAEIDCELWLDRSLLPVGLNCRDSRFSYSLSLESSVLGHTLALDNAGIKGSLFLGKGRFVSRDDYDSARLRGVQVGGQISMTEAEFTRRVLLERASVKEDLYLREAKFQQKASFYLARIDGHIMAEGTEFAALDLEDTKCDAFCDGKCRGSDEACWPDDLNLDRFQYQHLRGKAGEYESEDLTDRTVRWFKEWLAKQKKYSPQPYQQCARVLREAGQPEKANAVLFACMDRERDEPDGRYGRWLFLTASKYFLGYCRGKRFFWHPAGWAALLWFVGALFCLQTAEAATHSWYWCMGYSLNRLIPLVDLHPSFKTATDLGFGPSAWFMFQTLCGWFLAALIIAGLAGVGKPGGRD